MFDGFYAGRKVLVTGDTGFKGSWLCHWLVSLGADVCGLALPPRPGPSIYTELGLARRIRHRDIDVRDAAGISAFVNEHAPYAVFHLAAQPLVRASYQDPKETFDTNVGGTVNVLEAIRACKAVRACVVVTSDKCYENRDWPWGYREIDALGGHDPYSASKAATELVAASYRSSFFAAAGVRLATARAGNVIGGGDWSPDRLVTDVVESLRAGSPVRLRNPTATRPWQHVLEPLSGYLQLASRLGCDDGASVSEAWNFGPAASGVVTVETLARELARAWGSGTVEPANPPPAGQPHEAHALSLDCGKAAARLGWHGVWPVSTAVASTIAWYQEHYAHRSVVDETSRQLAAYVAAATTLRLPWTALERRSPTWTN